MINNKEKAYLKSKANTLKPIFQIGKDGLGNKQIESISDALEAHELVKINVLKTCSSLIREIALDLAGHLKADIVQIIGRTIVFYRPSKKKLIDLKEARK